MKKLIGFFLVVLALFFACKNKSQPPSSDLQKVETKKVETPANPSEVVMTNKSPQSTNDEPDYWTENDCTRAIPEPTFLETARNNTYSFSLNKKDGFVRETMTLKNSDQIIFTNRGCNTIWYQYAFYLADNGLELEDELAVSKKVLELIDRASEILDPFTSLKSHLVTLTNSVEQEGAFKIGETFVLDDDIISESFTLDKAERKDGKILLEYSYSFGPL